jgi:hypothetical protein
VFNVPDVIFVVLRFPLNVPKSVMLPATETFPMLLKAIAFTNTVFDVIDIIAVELLAFPIRIFCEFD